MLSVIESKGETQRKIISMNLNLKLSQPATPEDTLQQVGSTRGYFAHMYVHIP